MIKITNRKAYYEYAMIKEYIAGIQLLGSEVKSLRNHNASITEAYCYTYNGEIYLKNCHIAKYEQSTYQNHEERRDRKLLLNKKEINDIIKLTRENGITIIPLEIFTMNGKFKLKISVARGKKDFDKRNSIKDKDIKSDIQRNGYK